MNVMSREEAENRSSARQASARRARGANPPVATTSRYHHSESQHTFSEAGSKLERHRLLEGGGSRCMMFAFDEVRLHLLGTIVCTVALVNAVS